MSKRNYFLSVLLFRLLVVSLSIAGASGCATDDVIRLRGTLLSEESIPPERATEVDYSFEGLLGEKGWWLKVEQLGEDGGGTYELSSDGTNFYQIYRKGKIVSCVVNAGRSPRVASNNLAAVWLAYIAGDCFKGRTNGFVWPISIPVGRELLYSIDRGEGGGDDGMPISIKLFGDDMGHAGGVRNVPAEEVVMCTACLRISCHIRESIAFAGRRFPARFRTERYGGSRIPELRGDIVHGVSGKLESITLESGGLPQIPPVIGKERFVMDLRVEGGGQLRGTWNPVSSNRQNSQFGLMRLDGR